MRLRFKILFWAGLAMFVVVTSLASWGLFELRSLMAVRRSANNMQMTLHSMLESLQEADIIFLLSNSRKESEIAKVVALVNLAHQKAVALTHMDLPSEPIRKEISELEEMIRGKVKTEDDYMVSGDMFEEPVVKKVTTMRDNLVLTKKVNEKIAHVDHLLIEYQSQHLVYVDEYFDMNLTTITVGMCLSFGLFMLFARLVSREIERRTQLEVELRQAQEAAIAASALKSQFLATVSHEVRTPLNGILGMSELIRDKAEGEIKKYARVINQSGRNLLRIVNDILDFSRLEANRLQLELQEVRLSNLLEMAADLFGPRANENKVRMTLSYSRTFEDRFAADGSRISQILHNLVGNAVKFTTSGHIHIVGSVIEDEDDEFKMRFAVEDSGFGIASDKADLIFQPFQQTETEHQREGTGLGLSICKRLVEMMGGTIQFTSQNGRGSKFWFELPLRRLRKSSRAHSTSLQIYAYKLAPDIEETLAEYAKLLGTSLHVINNSLPTEGDKPLLICATLESVKALSPAVQKVALAIDFPSSSHAPAAWGTLTLPLTFERFQQALQVRLSPEEIKGASPSPSQALVARGNGLILLVEDNSTNQILAQTQLEQLGYRVDVATNGAECLKAMGRMNYDLILMDCRMPVMDGFTATMAIRELERKRQSVRVPVIAITANALEGDRHRCLAAGMDDYMTKPIERAQLQQLMEKWMTTEKTQIDWRVVSDLANRTSNEVVKRLLNSFRNTLSVGLEKIEQGLQHQDWNEISMHAHQLKSSGAAIGAVTLSHICAQIESEIEANARCEVSLCEQSLLVGRRVLEELSTQTRYT